MKPLRHLLGAVAIAQIGMAGAGLAQDHPVVIELFTSQGCSSCPPADELLAEMAGNAEVLALAFHVDYWDYLGWKDDLADPAYTLRQKDYAHAIGERMIYTPQAIVNGRARLVGSDAQAVMSAVMHEMNVDPQVEVSANRSGGSLQVTGKARENLTGPIDVVLVRFVPKVTVDILHGENAGETITYVNTVTDLISIGTWDGQAPLSVRVPIDGAASAAVLLQAADMGQVLAAALVK